MTELDGSLLRKLAEWDSGGAPITSLSITVDGRRYPRKADVEVRLDELLRRARAQAASLDRDAARSVERDTEAMSSFFRDEFERGDTRGLAMFSSHAAGLWEVVPTPRAIRDRVNVGPEADLLPLEMLLETYRPTCLALVDFEKARLFVIELGRIDEMSEITDDVPGRHDQGGWSQPRRQRHVDDHRSRHLKHVAAELFALWQRRPFEHLVLAGPAEAHKELEPDLHDYLRQRVRAHLVMQMTATTSEVLEKVLELEEHLQAETDRAVVEQLVAAARANGRGVIGLDPTLEALAMGRAGELVVSLQASSPGVRCHRCGRLASSGETCPTCGAPTEQVPDIVDVAVAVAFRSGTRVETIGDVGSMPSFDGVGALLRF